MNRSLLLRHKVPITVKREKREVQSVETRLLSQLRAADASFAVKWLGNLYVEPCEM